MGLFLGGAADADGGGGEASSALALTSATLQSLSVGLFIQLIFMGIIPAEFRTTSRNGVSGYCTLTKLNWAIVHVR